MLFIYNIVVFYSLLKVLYTDDVEDISFLMDYDNLTFICPRCGRKFDTRDSCINHGSHRKHLNILNTCLYEGENIPDCDYTKDELRNMEKLKYGSCCVKGRRRYMEDFHASFRVSKDPTADFFGVFDGHLGNQTSSYLASEMPILISEYMSLSKNWNFSILIDHIFNLVESNLYHKFLVNSNPSGSTATVLLRTDNNLVLANVGDSHGVVCCPFEDISEQSSQFISYLTEDHRISNYNSHTLHNYISPGHFIEDHRLNGSLQLSRSIGDFRFKPLISSQPFFTVIPRRLDYHYMIIATDGLWDVISTNDAINIVNTILSGHGSQDSLSHGYIEAAKFLTKEAYSRGSSDNICTLVIGLN